MSKRTITLTARHPNLSGNLMRKSKQAILSVLFLFSFASLYAQQGYKAILDSFSFHAKNRFLDIKGAQTDTLSIFYPSKLKPNVGDVKIGVYPNTATLNWSIPLSQSEQVQKAAREYIKTSFSDSKLFQIVSDGTEEEGDITTNVYAVKAEKPLLVFQTIYYKNAEDTTKSSFSIVVYAK